MCLLLCPGWYIPLICSFGQSTLWGEQRDELFGEQPHDHNSVSKFHLSEQENRDESVINRPLTIGPWEYEGLWNSLRWEESYKAVLFSHTKEHDPILC